MTEEILFISDLHLAAERPQIIDLFGDFVDDIAAGADTLYILGDFLEYWIGDDGPATGLQPDQGVKHRLLVRVCFRSPSRERDTRTKNRRSSRPCSDTATRGAGTVATSSSARPVSM